MQRLISIVAGVTQTGPLEISGKFPRPLPIPFTLPLGSISKRPATQSGVFGEHCLLETDGRPPLHVPQDLPLPQGLGGHLDPFIYAHRPGRLYRRRVQSRPGH